LNNRSTKLSKDGTEIYSDFVFPSNRTDGHIDGLRRVMNRVLAKAEVPHARIHDLRHTFASFAIANKADLLLVSKLLGHANTRVTERYAHLTSDPLEEAVGRDVAP
jgi:integrase